MTNEFSPHEARCGAQRRNKLAAYARTLRTLPNKCQALVNIIHYDSLLVATSPVPNLAMIADLQAVLIGTGLTNAHRNTGPYFAGGFNGSDGFREIFRSKDPQERAFGNQVQHAVAGIVIGATYGRGVQSLVRRLEEEPEDIALYRATFPLGEKMGVKVDRLDNPFYKHLSEATRKAISDGRCLPATDQRANHIPRIYGPPYP